MVLSRLMPAAALYAAAILLLGILLGTLRVLVLAPRLGAVAAVLIELPVILAASWVMAGMVLRRWPAVPPAAIGLLGFLLLMAGEFALARLAFATGPREWLGGFATLPGALGLAGQVVFALIPWWHGRA